MSWLDRALYRWWTSEARWWQFWRPGSGIVGALILNAILLGLAFCWAG